MRFEQEITVRVRYNETDRMGVLHHAQYLVYFELGRIEILRKRGLSYRELEDQGYLMVINRLEVKYKRPAMFDDLVRLLTWVERVTTVSVEHAYELTRDGELLAQATSTLVCINRQGGVQMLHPLLLPEEFRDA